jgi:hypothetical protein
MYSLFDYEHNRDADTFIRIFCGYNLRVVSKLNLSSHILNGNMSACKQCALKILEIYANKNNLRQPS